MTAVRSFGDTQNYLTAYNQ